MKKAIVCMFALVAASVALFLAGHPWLAALSLYFGATIFVLLFIHGATAKATAVGLKDAEDGLAEQRA